MIFNSLTWYYQAYYYWFPFFLFIVANEKTDLEDIKEILGHKDIKTTEIYARISQKRVREAYFKHSKEI